MITLNENVQELAVSNVDSTQQVSLEQAKGAQMLAVDPMVTFLRGDDGVSPTVNVEEVDGGYNVVVTDKEHTETVFIANGKSVTDKQVQEAVNAYLEEHPVSIDVADAAIEGDMRPITSNAVHVEMGNINALLKTI